MEEAELQKIAKTARLKLSEREGGELCEEIAEILSKFRKIQELAEGREFEYMTPAESVTRKDGEPEGGEDVMENVPKREGGFVKVPKGI